MTLQQLHYVITISETGSLNKASEILYVTQPSLTSAIKELERETGITIFYRSGRGVTLTNEGEEFLLYARQVYQQYDNLLEKYVKSDTIKKKFCVSTQHYSFAVKAFVETVKRFDTSKYEFAIRETKTHDVISDVSTLRSEIGLLYLSDFNKKIITRLLNSNNLEFHKLITCKAYVYVWRKHPLAKNKTISFSELLDYPCLSFEQGANSSFYFAEEMMSVNENPRVIKACDRATMLNLMVGLNGYTICSGIICEELNGREYVAIPLEMDEDDTKNEMEIGYIVRKNNIISNIGNLYIEEIKKYLKNNAK